MSQIETTAYSPENIGKINFRIPLYQRPYAWETKQVYQFLHDLHVQFKKDKTIKYYIGILSIGKTENNSELYDLIDGQQRITTLLLTGRVLVKLMERDAIERFDGWKDFLKKERLDFYGRDEDMAYLEQLHESPKTNKKMVDAVKTIEDFIMSKDNRNEFSRYVYENAAFFLSVAPDDYTVIEKNLQFVRMNNRGKQLESHDILKIKLASVIPDPVKRNKFINDWNSMAQLGCNDDSSADQANNSQSLQDLLRSQGDDKAPPESEIFYQSIVNFPEFLLIGLERFFTGNGDIVISHDKDKLLEEFGFGEKKVAFEWTEATVYDFIGFLQTQFESFNRYFIKRDKNERYKFKDNEDESFITNDIFLERLKMFQSYLYVSREPHHWLTDAFDYCSADINTIQGRINAEAFLQYMKEKDNNKHQDAISLEYGKIDRYWFWRLDYYLWEHRSVNFSDNKGALEVANKYVFRTNRSIEHIGPQTLKEGDVGIDREILHSFGNLAMIPSGQNSSLQNESFNVKRAHVQAFIEGNKNVTIESLKLLKIFNENTWSDESIRRHGREMIQVLIESFLPSENYASVRKHLSEEKKKLEET